MSFKWWVVIAVLLFAGGLVWGLSVPTSGGLGLLSEETKSLQNMARAIDSLPQWEMFVLILTKNITAVLFSFVMSPFLLVLPLVSLILNGWLVGAVAPDIVSRHSIGYLLAGIVPHGVFELPALFIGEAAGLSFGVAAMMTVLNKERREQFSAVTRSNVKYLIVSLVLFVPAAAVETYVTPWLLKR